MSKIDLSGLKIGMENTLSIIVSDENSAEAVGYKGMPVLGTPGLLLTPRNFSQTLKKRITSVVFLEAYT